MADILAEGHYKATIAAFALRNVEARHSDTGVKRVVPVLDLTATVKDNGKSHNVRGSLFLASDDAKGDKPCSRDANFRRLRDIGWNGEPDGQFKGLVGSPVDIEVEHKASGGKTYANVKYFNVPPKNSVDMGAARALFGDTAKPLADDGGDIPF